MKTGTLGAAVVTGYVLGRFHKMKWALAIAGIAGGKSLAGKQGSMLGQATELAKSTGLDQLTGDLRGRLAEAGKKAAVTAVSSKIDSFSEGLRSRSESLRGDGRPSRRADEAGESADAAEPEAPEDAAEPEAPGDAAEPEDGEDSQHPAGRAQPGGRRPGRGDGSDRPPRRRGEDRSREAARPPRPRSGEAAADERRASGSRRGGSQ